MVELQHRAIPTPALTQYITTYPGIGVHDFDSRTFQPIKAVVKADLNADQGGLCVYCESHLAEGAGQVEHIKPKGGPNAHPYLCFTYTNYAHSCINNKTCGQSKGGRLLPIEPGPGCNTEWGLSTDGSIQPVSGLTATRRHVVVQTRDMLGLNRDANLVSDRQKWLSNVIKILEQSPADLPSFLQTAPYRFMLAATV
jgi:uncharacterized protein (TIGR02646 family)